MVVVVGETVVAEVLDPVLHTKVSPLVAESVILAPVQILPSLLLLPEVSLTEMIGNCSKTTVMVELLVAVQPLSFVTTTEYVVVESGVTTSAAAAAPVFQRYDVPPDAVRVALAPIRIIPSFRDPELSVTDMEGVGSELTVMAEDVDEKQWF